MPKNLTPVNNWATNISVPVGGDPRRASSVETPFQNIADRLQWLKAGIDTIDPNRNGTIRLRKIANLTTLKGLTGMVDGESVIVLNSIGHALYTYYSGSAATADEPWIVQPDTGSGRWIHCAATAVTNRILGVHEYTYTSAWALTTLEWHAFEDEMGTTDYEIAFPYTVRSTDKVFADLSFRATISGNTHSFGFGSSLKYITVGATGQYHVNAIISGADITGNKLTPKYYAAATGLTTELKDFTLRAIVIRP